MKITLRTARKLDNKLVQFIKKNELKRAIVDPWGENGSDQGKLLRLQNSVLYYTTIDAITARYALRSLIQTANEEIQLNALITEKRQLMNLITFCEDLRKKYETFSHITMDGLNSRMESYRNVNGGVSTSRYTYGEQSVNGIEISPVSSEMLAVINNDIKKYTDRLEFIEDNIISTNSTAYVYLTDELVCFLTKFELL